MTFRPIQAKIRLSSMAIFFELTCMTSKQKFLSSMTFCPIQANEVWF
jgi:hypothetical protein